MTGYIYLESTENEDTELDFDISLFSLTNADEKNLEKFNIDGLAS